MHTAFDPDDGVLRLAHGSLSVLARLAVAPTDPALVDHGTAPPLAELRRAGIVGPGGIHAEVRPLAEVVGAPAASFDLDLREGATPWRRCRGWLTTSLAVVAVPVAHEVYDLVADRPGELGALLGDLVGLVDAPIASTSPVEVDDEELDELLVGAPHPQLAGAGTGRARWRLAMRRGGPGDQPGEGRALPSDEHDAAERTDVLEVLDDGRQLWLLEPSRRAAGRRLVPVAAVEVRRRIGELAAAALRT